jgi:hypothetical protein
MEKQPGPKIQEELKAHRLGIQLFVPYNGVIAAGLTHADTNKHTLDLAAALPETRKIIAVVIAADRGIGTGFLLAYPNEEAYWQGLYNSRHFSTIIVIANNTQRLQYSLTVANDTFEVDCCGYVVEA